MTNNFFGTDGIRGLANVEPMDSDTIMRLGRAAACVFRRSEGRHRILIGKDTRLSGYMIETALCSGIVSMGVDVLLKSLTRFKYGIVKGQILRAGVRADDTSGISGTHVK